MGACNSQNKKKENLNHTSKINTMEYFDINNYKDWEIDPDWDFDEKDKKFIKDNIKIRIILDEENIQVERTTLKSPYKNVKVYSSINNILLAEGDYFYYCSIGIDKEYNEKGNVISEENFDKDYKLSIENIIQLMKKDYNIDLLDVSDRKSVDRDEGDSNNPPTYFISIPVKNTRSNRQITINANDGSLIKDQIVNPDAKFLKNKK